MPSPIRDAPGLRRLRAFLRKPRTLWEIEKQFGLSPRTAYRWLDYLREDGERVIGWKNKHGQREYSCLTPFAK
jgi:transposase